MMLFYYEEIAAEVCMSDPKDLFVKDRRTNPKLARQFCMVYRNTVLKMSTFDAAKRYHKDHATVVHAKKCINNFYKTRDKHAQKYDEFLLLCKLKRPVIGVNNTVDTFNADYFEFIDDMSLLFQSYLSSLYRRENEKSILEMTDKISQKLHEIKSIYE